MGPDSHDDYRKSYPAETLPVVRETHPGHDGASGKLMPHAQEYKVPFTENADNNMGSPGLITRRLYGPATISMSGEKVLNSSIKPLL